MAISIKKRIILSQTIPVLLVTLILGISFYLVLKNRFISQQTENLQRISQELAIDLSFRIGLKVARLESLSKGNFFDSFIESQGTLSSGSAQNKDEGFSVLSYVNAEGFEVIRIVKGKISEDVSDFSGTSLFMESMINPDRVILSPIFKSPELGVNALRMALAGYSSQSKPHSKHMGTIIGVFPISDLTGRIDSYRFGNSGFCMIFDEKGSILASSGPKSIDSLLINQENYNSLRQGNSSGIRIDDFKYLGAMKVTKSPDWTIIVLLPYKEITDFLRPFWVLVIAVFIIIFLVTAFISLELSKAISIPLIDFIDAANRTSEGDYSSPIETYKKHSKGEVGKLSKALKMLTKNLENITELNKKGLMENRLKENFDLELSEIKKVEEKNIELQAELFAAQKSIDFSKLTETSIIELNNTIKGLLKYLDLLILKLPPDSLMQKPVWAIKNEGNRASAIVQDMMILTNKDRMALEPVNINNIVREWLKNPEYSNLKKNIPGVRIETDLAKDLFHFLGSPFYLKKTIVNVQLFLSYLIKTEGVIFITTGKEFVKKGIRYYDRIIDDNFIILSVNSPEAKIPEKSLAKLFDPYFIKNITEGKGTGLELAVVQKTVEDQQGYVDCNIDDKKGLIFTFYFPYKKKNVVV